MEASPYGCQYTDMHAFLHLYIHLYIHTFIHTYLHSYCTPKSVFGSRRTNGYSSIRVRVVPTVPSLIHCTVGSSCLSATKRSILGGGTQTTTNCGSRQIRIVSNLHIIIIIHPSKMVVFVIWIDLSPREEAAKPTFSPCGILRTCYFCFFEKWGGGCGVPLPHFLV